MVDQYGKQFGTNGATIINRSLEVLSYLGSYIEINGFPTDFIHGMVEEIRPDVLRINPFDLPSYVDTGKEVFEERVAIERQLGLESDAADALRTEVPQEFVRGIQVASGYYNREARPLIGATVGMLITILEEQCERSRYGLSPDGINVLFMEVVI